MNNAPINRIFKLSKNIVMSHVQHIFLGGPKFDPKWGCLLYIGTKFYDK